MDNGGDGLLALCVLLAEGVGDNLVLLLSKRGVIYLGMFFGVITSCDTAGVCSSCDTGTSSSSSSTVGTSSSGLTSCSLVSLHIHET